MSEPAKFLLLNKNNYMYITKYLFHKTYKFGYVQDVKVMFKFDFKYSLIIHKIIGQSCQP